MSTHDSAGIPFEVTDAQEHFRLLELPSKLVEQLQSSKPPCLYLKSAASTADNAAGAPSRSNAVLCTDDQTFLVRQVHSSNSIFVIKPSRSVPNAEEYEIPAEAGVSAIAQCETTLELISSTASGVNILKSRLSQYTGSDSSTQDTFTNQSRLGKKRLCDNVPLSRAEYEAAWVEKCAFDLDENAMLPSATSLQGAWKSIVSAATVRGLKLEDSIRVQDIISLVEEDGFPRGLLQAVVGRLSLDQVVPREGWVTLSPEKCVPWVGIVVLESYTVSNEGVSVSTFLQDWRDLLPETWRERAVLGILQDKYLQPAKDRIMSRDAAAGAGYSTPSETTNTSGKRPGKWHEKFKNARR